MLSALSHLNPSDAAALFPPLVAGALALRGLWRLWCRRRRAEWAGGLCSLDVLQTMPPNDFETFTAAAFEARGWRVSIVGREGKPDGGLDLLLSAGGRRAVVQCKRYRSRVGASVVRETVGVMLHHKAQGAFVVALSGFTKPAIEWAKGKPIKLIDGGQLIRAIEREELGNL